MRTRSLMLGLTTALLAIGATAGWDGRLEVSISAGRVGPCSATLRDGRSLITGGGEAPLTTAQYFSHNGSTRAAPSMAEPRAKHLCVTLANDTVLVAGGIGASNRPTYSAEIFHPATGEWISTGPMVATRTGASAHLLADGQVLIAGGQVDGEPASTLEIYDSTRGAFYPVTGMLSTPRTGHALAALADGRILIAGGSGPGGVALDSTDMFDPVSRTVVPGPRMLARRTRFSATRLLDGKVLLSGGADGSSDLASAEIFDPETNQFSFTAPMRMARSGHLAVVLRDNGRVLIVGGVAGGEPVTGAELFIPWRGEFEAA